MLSSSSSFIHSTLSIYHPALKSLLFSVAQLLLAMAIYILFSLIAAKASAFAAYLMYTEDILQKSHFIVSRGLSGSSILVFTFALTYFAASLYGTLLWGFDAPGYIMAGRNVSAASLVTQMLDSPAYILYLDMKRSNLGTLDQELPQLIGANLFKAGSNFTLTPDVERGRAEFVSPVRTGVGGRVWLDGEGLSVGPDTQVMVSYKTDGNGTTIGMECPVQEVSDVGVAQFWNCTVDNTFVLPLLTTVVGRPEVHWDVPSDEVFDSRYIRPDRQRNIWAGFGQGGGTAGMKQMFTVTRGTRRHTFIETTFRSTMLTTAAVPFSSFEVMDMLKRTWSTNITEQQAPILTRLSNSILEAQATDQSFLFGTNDADNVTATQVTWEYLTPENSGRAIYSLLRITTTNITVIRSETIPTAPIPFAPCDISIQNIAYGGVLSDTDCATATEPDGQPKQFFGQVDTSAVLILYGLGDGRSNLSALALDETVYEWTIANSERMDNLLLARGYIVSINASLVTVEMSVLKPAISYLQLFLVLLAIVVYGIAWLSLKLLATSHWSSSLLLNLLAPMGKAPGYLYPVPAIKLWEAEAGTFIAVGESVLRVDAGGFEAQGQMAPGSMDQKFAQQPQVMVSERESFLPQYQQPIYAPRN
ncbi:hypothetical protein LSUE1_G010046 [Lachnellula suecica]|uniref:Uncharacterized protein n=1 Tax=Lachnellula suecica TaxID=602035 RepID=A0A8T9BZD6_9HELO|nr:hypothetical protein LSUE1_G010046 [Lachnellula suecica]